MYPILGIKRPVSMTVLTAAPEQPPERRWTAWLLSRERSVTGRNSEEVRQAVARTLGVAPGTIENLARGRMKGVRKSLSDKIRGAFVHAISTEIAALERELDSARRADPALGEDDLLAVEAHLASARRVLQAQRARG